MCWQRFMRFVQGSVNNMRHWLEKVWPSKKEPIIVVSGLPRSGTSMMMRMLAAGGLPVLTDGARTADEDNPHGYFELEAVKGLPQGQTSWLAQAPGRGVKVIATLLPHLPSDYEYQIIFMRRSTVEIVASQAKMLARRGATNRLNGTAQKVLDAHLRETGRWLQSQDHLSVLEVYYEDVLTRPLGTAETVQRFLNRRLAVERMTTAVDRSLYRNQHERSVSSGTAQG